MDRWEAFTEAELRELWDALTMDDGLRYGVAPENQPTYNLAVGILAEAGKRGMQLPDADTAFLEPYDVT